MDVYVREIRNRNRGMFSVVNEVVDDLTVAEREGYALTVRWTSCYEERGMGPNAWPYYFEDCFDPDATGAEIVGLLPIRSAAEGRRIAPRVAGGLGLPTDRDAVHGVIDRHLRLKPRVRERLEEFARLHFADRPILGLHIRGAGRALPALTTGLELLHGVPFARYFEDVDAYLDGNPDARIFVCSDAELVIETVRARYGPRVFAYPAERAREGEAHLLPASRERGYKLGEDILVEAQLLSRVDFLVHGNSNVTNFVLCNSPRLGHAYIHASPPSTKAEPARSRAVAGAEPALDFVRACLSVHLDPGAREALRNQVANRTPDWHEVARLADRERVAPLLFRVLREEAGVPAELRQRLRHVYLATASTNTILLQELQRIAARLDSVGVALLVLGDAAVARTAYEEIALRPIATIEALVRPEHLAPTRQALVEHGLEPRKAPAGCLSLIRPGALPVRLELRNSLFDSPFLQERVAVEEAWRGTMPYRLGEVDALVLDPPTMLLHLAGELALRHGRQGVLSRHDIAALLRRSAFDWPMLRARAREFALTAALRDALPAAAGDP